MRLRGKIKKPLLRYPGGKFRLLNWLGGFVPPHKIYTESFCGPASLLFWKEPAITEVINDTNSDVVNVFQVLRDPVQSGILKELVRLTPFAREEYELCYVPSDDPIEKARRYICRASFSQRKGPLQKSGFDTRINGDSYCGRVNYHKNYHRSIDLFTERLKQVVVENRDALDVISQFDRPETFHFVDPPYLAVDNVYPDKFGEEKHRQLSDVLLGARGKIILCGYQSEEYRRWYEENDWARYDAKAYADGGHKRTESIWLNPAAQEFQTQTELFKQNSKQNPKQKGSKL